MNLARISVQVCFNVFFLFSLCIDGSASGCFANDDYMYDYYHHANSPWSV